jgi:hypothetical protein
MKRLKITDTMKPVRTSPKTIRAKPFDVGESLKHIDPDTAEEAEEFVRLRKEMAVEKLVDLIKSLTPLQQEAVRDFIVFLKQKGHAPATSFLAAVDEFIEGHPELLRSLAR